VQATFLSGFDGTRAIYEGYRKGWREAGRGDDVPLHRLAYAALAYTAPTESEALAGAEKLLWIMTSNKSQPQFTSPPGYLPVPAMVQLMRGANNRLTEFVKNPSVERAIETGLMIAGTPDQVLAQIKRFYDYVGGFGHFLMMSQGGFLTHDETVKNIRSFARDVYPALRELTTASVARSA
jgi:alkanesulfonate monooxygenase SsuD/methylene tetrahydromethanopterin reductase-like flavin-dependent oxidoreductase (luciferase family)